MRLSRFMVRKGELTELQIMLANLTDKDKAARIDIAGSELLYEGVLSVWTHTRTPEGYTTGIRPLYEVNHEG